MPQYDDLPAGAEVIDSPGVSFSDLPAGAQILPQKYSATNLPPGLQAPAPNIPKTGFLKALGGDLKNMAVGTMTLGAAAAGNPYAQQQFTQGIAEQIANAPQEYRDRKQAGYSAFYRTVAPIAQAAGVNVPGMEKAAAAGDPGGILGHSAAPLVAYGAALGAGRALGSPTPLDAETAASRLADAVNPTTKKLLGFEKDLSKHFDKVTQYARDNNITINSRESLGKAMQGAADTQRAHYYDNILGPVRGESVSITDIPGYDGVAQGSTAMLGDLDARLSQINAELNPKYARGGIAGESAVKSAGELNAEAGAIRAKLYGELAKRTGLQATDIAGVRGSFGALRDLSEKTGLAAAQARTRANTIEQGPMTINPFSNSKQFLLDKAINAMRGDPAAKAISKTMNRAAISPFSPPQPIFTEKIAAYRPPPITQVGGTPVPSIFDRPEPAGAQGNPVRGPRPRPGANRVPLWKKMLAESLSEEK